MFFFRKISINEFFPKDFVDIHSHLLPGIDDGARTIDESIDLIRGLEKIGINRLITTPHIYGTVWPNSAAIISEKASLVQKEISDQNISVQLRFAAEYMLDDKFNQLLNQSGILTIKNKYILIEFPNFQKPLHLHEVLFRLNSLGFEPVLAHPERYTYFDNVTDQLRSLREIGCSFQLNLLSLAEHYGLKVYQTSIRLLNEGLIDFVGTDVHKTYHIEAIKRIATKKHRKLLEIPFQNNLTLW